LRGNAVRDDKLALLDPFRRIYLALDQDAGGRQGTVRLAAHVGARAVRIELPPGVKDVADLAKLPDGDDLFRAAIRRGVLSASLRPGMTQDNPAQSVSMAGA
jgi:DNA primase